MSFSRQKTCERTTLHGILFRKTLDLISRGEERGRAKSGDNPSKRGGVQESVSSGLPSNAPSLQSGLGIHSTDASHKGGMGGELVAHIYGRMWHIGVAVTVILCYVRFIEKRS